MKFIRMALIRRNEQSKKAAINRNLVHKAVSEDNVGNLRFLIEACGASVTHTGWPAWKYPTRVAVESRNAEMLRVLIKYGASLFDTDGIPVIFGVLSQDHEDFKTTLPLLDTYVELGGSVDVTDKDNMSILDRFIERRWWHLARRVAEHGSSNIFKSVFNKNHIQVEGFPQRLLPVVLQHGIQWSRGLEVEGLELSASHAWRYQHHPSKCDDPAVTAWFNEDLSIKSWKQLFALRSEAHQWRTTKEPFTQTELINSKSELIECVHNHLHGDPDLLVQCMLLQERLFGTIDATVAEKLNLHRWKSAEKYIAVLIYLSQFDVDLPMALNLPSTCHLDMKLGQVCTLVSHIFARENDSWDCAAAEFLLETYYNYTTSGHCRYRLQREARELSLDQRHALEELVRRQPWIRDMDDQLIADLLPQEGPGLRS